MIDVYYVVCSMSVGFVERLCGYSGAKDHSDIVDSFGRFHSGMSDGADSFGVSLS